MQEIGHWINGKLVAGTSGRFAEVMNPATGEQQARVALATLGELDHAIQEAAKAQVAWAATNPQRRARVMMAFGALINRDMDKLAEMVAREHGKTIPDAKGDVQRGRRGSPRPPAPRVRRFRHGGSAGHLPRSAHNLGGIW